MKTSKLSLLLILAVLLSVALNGCKKCKDEDPRARIINNGLYTASVHIQTSGGNTVNINNIDPGTTSEYSSYAAGYVTFTITTGGMDYVKGVGMSTCFDYDISIDAANNITATEIDRND